MTVGVGRLQGMMLRPVKEATQLKLEQRPLAVLVTRLGCRRMGSPPQTKESFGTCQKGTTVKAQVQSSKLSWRRHRFTGVTERYLPAVLCHTVRS